MRVEHWIQQAGSGRGSGAPRAAELASSRPVAAPLLLPEQEDVAVKWNTTQMAGRAASIATIWGVSKILSSPTGKKAAAKLDTRVTQAQKKTAKSVKRSVRNARSNAGWAAAGAVALAAAAALFGKATRK